MSGACTTALRFGCIVLLLGLAGCESFFPVLGPEQPGARCAASDSDPAKSVTFAQVQSEVLVPYCVDCHADGVAGNVGFATSGLELSSYAALMRGGLDGEHIVVPGDPCSSTLWRKLVGPGAAGSQMPLGGEPLSAAQIRLVSDWIVEGAHAD